MRSARREVRLRANLEDRRGLETTIRDYLSPRHRDDAGTAARPRRWSPRSRAIRSQTRDAFTGKIVGDHRADRGPDRQGLGRATRRKRAIAVYGLMVGALQLARAVNDSKLSDEILENAADAALKLAGER